MMRTYVPMFYTCKDCKKTARMDFIMCSSCGDYNGVTPMPAGWRNWPQPYNIYSYPTPVVCDECFDEKEYQKAQEQRKRADEFNRCAECGQKK